MGLRQREDVVGDGVGPQAVERGDAGHARGQLARAVREHDGVEKQRADPRILQQVGVVVFGRQRMHPGVAQAHHVGGRSDEEGLDAVGRQGRYRITVAQAALGEGLHQARQQVAHLAIGQGVIFADESNAIAAAFDGAQQQVAHAAFGVKCVLHGRQSCIRAGFQKGLVTMPPSTRSAAPLVALDAGEQT